MCKHYSSSSMTTSSYCGYSSEWVSEPSACSSLFQTWLTAQTGFDATVKCYAGFWGVCRFFWIRGLEKTYAGFCVDLCWFLWIRPLEKTYAGFSRDYAGFSETVRQDLVSRRIFKLIICETSAPERLDFDLQLFSFVSSPPISLEVLAGSSPDCSS